MRYPISPDTPSYTVTYDSVVPTGLSLSTPTPTASTVSRTADISTPEIGHNWRPMVENVWISSVQNFPVLVMSVGKGPKVREYAIIAVEDMTPVHTPNYRSALGERDFLTKKVKELLD